MINNDKSPSYSHHCNCCKFLGGYYNNQNIDLYFCTTGATPNVIARFSNSPNDYVRSLLLAKYLLQDYREAFPDKILTSVEILRSVNIRQKHPLIEAAARAIEQNLVDEKLHSASLYRPRIK